jgi:CO/xanthine dehydrogenase FAD-binding subunit
MAAHLLKVANTPVRGAACWAGNLMMAHDNNFFPSDVATLFLGVGATLTVASTAGTTTVATADFLTLDMNRKVSPRPMPKGPSCPIFP